ncbi:MAG: site-specific integrase [Bdellovibrionia bacterium]
MPEARHREVELLQEICNQAKRESQSTLEVWLEKWISQAHLSRKLGTVESYKKTLYKHIPIEVLRMSISDVGPNDVYKIVHNPEAKIKPKTRENLLQYIRVVFRDALHERLITFNPADGIKMKVPDTKLEAWTLTEVNRVLAEAANQGHPWFPIWVVTVFSGLRSGEAYALTWNNVDLENRRIYVVESWTSKDGFHETKNKRHRVVPINNELYPFLIKLKLQRGTEKFVLPHFAAWTKGKQAQVLREFAKLIEIREINFHALRASFITICLLQGVSVVKVQAMVGHEDLDTTMRYVRLVGSDLEGATENLGLKLPIIHDGEVVPLRPVAEALG